MIATETVHTPLVSIVVITYNSSGTLIETLESAKNQTYTTLELILSDDGSSDDTVEICRQWIAENKHRFVRTAIITTPSNTGIPANCNRGIQTATGLWVKLIAGDDILLESCIEEAMIFSQKNPDCKIFASDVVFFTDNVHSEANNSTQLSTSKFFNSNSDAKSQFKMLAYNNEILAPSVFILKQLVVDLKGFDETISYMEDYPFWLKVTQLGHKIGFLNRVTVGYRLNTSSVSGFSQENIFNKFYRTSYLFKKQYTFKFLDIKRRYSLIYIYTVQSLFDKFGMNKKKFRSLYQFCLKMNLLRYSFGFSKRPFSTLS